MREKLVKRYWCDFCNKAGLSASAMKRHEKHCTLNPDRECRVCKMVGAEGHTLASLVALLPDSRPYHADMSSSNGSALQDAIQIALPKVKEAAEGCPACVMAAFRQAKIPLPMVEGFDFSTEMKEIWANINEAQRERECQY